MVWWRILIELDGFNFVATLERSFGNAVHAIHHCPGRRKDDRV
jgi:hypothetical protein